MSDNVKSLPTRKIPNAETMLVEVSPWTEKCRHERFLVSEKLYEVTCADCGEKLNPVYALLTLCRKETNWHRTRQAYQEEMKRLSERSSTKCKHCGKMTRISGR